MPKPPPLTDEEGQALGEVYTANYKQDELEDLRHEVAFLRRDNINLQHHYKHHREAGEKWYERWLALQEALEAIQATGAKGTHTGDLHAKCCEIASRALGTD